MKQFSRKALSNLKMVDTKTLLNEESLTKRVKNICKKEFDKHEHSITKLVNGDFHINMEEIRKSRYQIKEIIELKGSFEFTENAL